MKTIYENDFYQVSETDDPHFPAVIENKTPRNITLRMDEEIAEENCIEPEFYIEGGDLLYLTNWEYTLNTAQALEQGDYEMAMEIDYFDMYDNAEYGDTYEDMLRDATREAAELGIRFSVA